MSADFIILDFETLGVTGWKNPVLSLGVYAGEWSEVEDTKESVVSMIGNGLEIFFNVKEQVSEFNREVSEETMDWWERQGEESKRIFKAPNKKSVRDLPRILSEYCRERGVDKETLVLIRAPHFDYVFLKSIYEDLGLKENDIPFSHWKVRDVRTIVDMHPQSDGKGYFQNFSPYMKENYGLVKHNALHDIIIDIVLLKYAMSGEDLPDF